MSQIPIQNALYTTVKLDTFGHVSDNQLKVERIPLENIEHNNETLVDWLNSIHTVLGLPVRDLEMEKLYPEMITIWQESLAEAIKNNSGVPNQKTLEYNKRCEKYHTFETLKKKE